MVRSTISYCHHTESRLTTDSEGLSTGGSGGGNVGAIVGGIKL